MSDELRSFLRHYSACDVCKLSNTAKCVSEVPYLSRAVFFTTPFNDHPNDEVTFHCKHFKLNKSELKRRTDRNG